MDYYYRKCMDGMVYGNGYDLEFKDGKAYMTWSDTTHKSNNPEGSFLTACKNKDWIKAIELVNQYYVSIKNTINYGLDWAYEYGNLEMVSYFLGKGANPRFNNSNSIGVACEHYSSNIYGDIIKTLIDHGADIEKNNGYAITTAAIKGNLELVKFLITRGANFHVKNENPLGWAAKNGHIKIVEYLLKKGAIAEANNLVLQESIINGHTEIVKILLQYGAQVIQNHKTSYLGHAVSLNRTDIVKLLFDFVPNLNVNPKGENGFMDVLTWASYNGNLELCVFLVNRGADINSEKGRPLQAAIYQKHSSIVKYLISIGVNQIGFENEIKQLNIQDDI